ncbi:hypothetical protein PO124_12745 [Bacillus licheniformis]|nr:hypothetical protein [Bacillus licheniformis]
MPGNSTRPEDKRNYTLLLQEVRKNLTLQKQKTARNTC